MNTPRERLQAWVQQQREMGLLMKEIQGHLDTSDVSLRRWLNGAVPQIQNRHKIEQRVGIPLNSWPKAPHTGRPPKHRQQVAP